LNHLNLNNLSKLNQLLMVGMSYLNRNLPLLGMDFRMALMDLSPPRMWKLNKFMNFLSAKLQKLMGITRNLEVFRAQTVLIQFSKRL